MQEREIPGWGYNSYTRNKILDEAARLIALKGFTAVTMRDIAAAVGINMSSIYYYYESKESLLKDIISRFEHGYRHYFDWLAKENKNAASLEELMDNLFNKEFVEMSNLMACLGMSLTIKEQHNSEAARELAFNLFFEHSIKLMQADFDRLVEKGIIAPADTKTIAMLIMACVIVGNDIRIHEYDGVKPPIDCTEMYMGLKNFIISALSPPTK
jgi:AcrR family transcriptional regulator